MLIAGCLEQKLKIIGKSAEKQKESGPRKTFRPPPSSVLGKVQAFLPQLASANEVLLSMPPSEVDIENVDPEHDGPLIEMNFALMPQLSSDDDESSEEDDSEDEDTDGDDKTEENLCGPSNSSQGEMATKKKVCVIDKDSEENAHAENVVMEQGCPEG
ncbi:hypothetical protein V1264_020554 [Littorina saxatilis]|uniref:Uncharacterized protein n=1 Tax=Littorina saxatilis TaxID=31220 RepID=A0AAN9GB02_9CAEN